MKKWVIIGMGFSTMVVWVLVLFVLFRPLEPSTLASLHSYSEVSLTVHEKDAGKIMSSRYDSLDKEQAPEQEVPTVIGERIITENWIKDVTEDGRLSIDTLLDSLQLKDS
ncbi:hypothetical protein LCL89_00240 [Halobacillus yeomjeoni]|uniref:hypothetical protein n=1 Tax=Halobacillus yeomjeoni TaxID=311194 RepID=UPI001CD7F2F1|nr:hypothetical protein [Halobacillus yeomjeoni]MCA0982469.1 hypothetical protein [Halobacillus yeomjeoni]